MKKYLFIIFTILCFLFLPSPVYADEIEVVKMVPHKSHNSIKIKDEYGYDFSVEFFDASQELSYDVTIKNTTSNTIQIDDIALSHPNSPNLDYSFQNIAEGEVLTAGDEKTFQMTIKLVGDITTTIDENFVFNLHFNESDQIPIYMDATNPQTGIIRILIILGIIAFSVLLFFNFFYKRNKTICFLLLLFLSIFSLKNVFASDYNLAIRGHVYYRMTYGVSINLNGGFYDNEEGIYQTDILDGNVLYLSKIHRDYYYIDHIIVNGEDRPYSDTIIVNENMSISIIWERIYYTVTIDPNGGKYSDNSSVQNFSVAAGDYISIMNPVRLGFNFVEWQINPSSSSLQNGRLFVDKNISLQAIWDEAYYTLTINPNGGTYNGVSGTQTYSYLYQTVVSLYVPVKEGATFSHWELSNGTEYTSSTITMDNDYSLKAIYNDIYFDVRIDPNGGTYKGSSSVYVDRVKYGSTISLNDIVRENYVFGGWYDENNNLVSGNSIVLKNNLNITAQWGAAQCRIGTTYYTSFQDAYRAASSNQTITLLQNYTGSFTNAKNIILDLNGYQVLGSIGNNYNLTILNGSVINENGIAIDNAGTLTLGYNDSSVSTSSVNIFGSTVGIRQNGVLNYYDGTIKGTTALSGGYNDTPYISNQRFSPFMNSDSSGYQQLTLKNIESAIAKINANGNIYFDNLSYGFDVSSNLVYTLYATKSFTVNENITINTGKTVTFDISGFSPTLEGSITNNGTFNILDSSNNVGVLNFKKSLINNGSLKLSNVKASQLTSSDFILNHSSLTLINSTISALTGKTISIITAGSSLNMDSNSYVLSTGGTSIYNTIQGLSLYNGHINSSYRAIHNNGGTINFNSGEILANSNNYQNVYAVYNENQATFNVSGGTISAGNNDGTAYGIYNDDLSSVLYLSSGNITVSNANNGYGLYNGTNVLVSGSISAKSYGVYNGKLTMGTNNSYVNSNTPIVTGELYGLYDVELSFYDGLVKGKTAAFNVKNIKDLPQGYFCKTKNENEYNIAYLSNQIDYFEVNNNTYSSLSNAYNATNHEGTIKVLLDYENTSDTFTIAENDNITIDLNGHSLYLYYYVNNGTLTIMDSSDEGNGLLRASNSTTINNNNVLNINSGTVSGTNRTIYNVSNSSVVNINGGKVQAEYTSYTYAIYNNYGKINVNGGEILAQNVRTTSINNTYNQAYAIYNYYQNCEVKIYGGKVSATSINGAAYGVNFYRKGQVSMFGGEVYIDNSLSSYGFAGTYTSSMEDGVIKIVMNNSSTSNQSSAYGISYGTNTITGGSIIIINNNEDDISRTAIGIHSGTSTISGGLIQITSKSPGSIYGTLYCNNTISGGSIVVNGEHNSLNSYGIYGSSTTLTDMSLNANGVNPQNTYGMYSVSATITGGQIISNGYGLCNGTYRLGINDDTISNTTPEIIGDLSGIFSTVYDNVSLYFYDGIIKGKNKSIPLESIQEMPTSSSLIQSIEDDYHICYITHADKFFEVNNNQFPTFAEAYNSIDGDSGTIKVINNNISWDSLPTIDSSNNITIDLNGHNFYSFSTITNNGVLKITDTSENSKGIFGLLSTQTGITNNGSLEMSSISYIGNSVLVQNATNKSAIFNDVDFISNAKQYSSYGLYNSGEITIQDCSLIMGLESNGATYTYYGVYNYSNTSITRINGFDLQIFGYNTYGLFNSSEQAQFIIESTNINVSGSNNSYGIYNGNNLFKSGSIISTKNGIGAGQTLIGQSDGIISNDLVSIKAEYYGLYNCKIEFFDGIIQGKNGVSDDNCITKTPDRTNLHKESIDGYDTAYIVDSENYLEVDNVEYDSFISAYNAISGSSGTIKVINSYTTTMELVELEEGKTITLDLNGQTVGFSQTLVNSGTLIIIDSSEDKHGSLYNNGKNTYTIQNKNVFNLESGTIGNSYMTIRNESNATTNINGGTVKNEKRISSTNSNSNNNFAIYNCGTVNVNDGQIIADNSVPLTNHCTSSCSVNSNSDPIGVYNYGSSSKYAILNINGGTISSVSSDAGAIGVYGGSYSKVIMNGGQINVNGYSTGVGIYSGTNTINSGTINEIDGTNSGYGFYNGTNTVIEGIVHSSGYGAYYGSLILGTNDNELSSTSPEIVGELYGTWETSLTIYDGIIKGKTADFQENRVLDTADGTSIVHDTIDDYIVGYLRNNENYLRVGNHEFNSLNQAMAAIEEDGTITVIASAKIGNKINDIPSSKNITLDLNGYDFELLQPITNKGTFTITDSSENQDGYLRLSSPTNTKNSKTMIVQSGNIVTRQYLYNTGTLTVNGGLITNGGFSSTSVLYNYSATINLNGGEINYSYDSSTNASSSVIYNYTRSSVAVVNVNGAKISANTSNSITGISQSYYSSTKSKLNFVSGEINLNSSAGKAYGISGASTNIITSAVINLTSFDSAYGINSGTTNTIEDIDINITSDATYSYGIYGGTTTIKTGNIMGGKYGIYNSTVSIGENDNSISSDSPVIVGELYAIYGGKVDFFDGILKGKTAAYSDGIIKLVADGSIFHSEEVDDYYVAYLSSADNYFEVDGTLYNSMIQAYNSITGDEGTISVIKSFESSAELPVIGSDKVITLDLNGFEMTLTPTLTVNGTLNVIDSSQNKTGVFYNTIDPVITNSGGIVNINECKIKAISKGIYNTNSGVTNLNGGSIEILSPTRQSIYAVMNKSGVFNLNSGTISVSFDESLSYTDYAYGIYNDRNSNSDPISEISILDGSIIVSGNYAYGLYSWNGSILHMYDGSLNVHGVQSSVGVYYGTNTIDDGQITVTSNSGTAYGFYYGSNTINDVSISAVANDSSKIGYGFYYGTSTILGGEISGSSYGTYYGTVTLGSDDSSVSAESPSIVGGLYGSYGGSVYFYDGILKGKTGAHTENVIKTIPEGYIFNYEIIDEYNICYLAVADNYYEVNGVEYKSLQRAYESITSSDEQTIKLIKSVVTSEPVPTIENDKNIVFDLNGFEVSYSEGFVNNGTFKIIDSSNEKSGCLTFRVSSSITNNGTLLIDANITGISSIIYNNSATAVVNYLGGKLTAVLPSSSSTVYGIYNKLGRVNFNGGEIALVSSNTSIHHSLYGIYNTNDSNCIVNMNGGVINLVGYDAYGISVASNNKNPVINVHGGTINVFGSNTGYGIYGGTTTVDGGSIVSSKYGIYDSNVVSGIDDDNIDNSFTIQGEEYALYSGSFDYYDGTLKGKTDTYQPTILKKIADKTVVQSVVEGAYKKSYIVEATNFLEVNNVEYNSFKQAYDAITDSEGTIKVINSISTYAPMPTIDSSKTITLDLNGYTVGIGNTLVNSGTLNIVDTTEQKNGNISGLSNDKATIENGLTLNLYSGTISSIYQSVKNANSNSVLNVVGGTIHTESNSVTSIYGVYNNYGKVNVNSGQIIVNQNGTTHSYSYNAYGVYSSNSDSSVVTVNGGKIIVNGSNYYAYGIYGGVSSCWLGNCVYSNTKAAILSGEISVTAYYEGMAFYYGNTTISGGTINVISTAGTAYGTCYGSTTMSGGEINVNGSTNSYGMYEGSRTILAGSISSSFYGIYNASTTLGSDENNVDFNYPLIIGDLYGIYSGSTNYFDGTIRGKTAAVSTDNISVTASGYKYAHTTVDDYDAIILVETDNYVEVNGVYYNSIATAYNSIVDSEGTIKLVNSQLQTDSLVTIANGKNITLDLNGFTMNTIQPIKNYGVLNIIDSSENQNGVLNNTTSSAITNYATLNVNSGTLQGNNQVINNNSNGTVNVNGGLIKAYKETGSIYGIYNNNGTINFIGGRMEVGRPYTNSSSGLSSYGFYNGDCNTCVVNIQNSVVDIQGDNGTGVYNYFYDYSRGRVYIKTGAEININVKNSAYGTNEGNIYMTGGSINLQSSSGSAQGIHGSERFEMSGGIIDADFNKNNKNGYGVYWNRNTIITGGEIKASCQALYSGTVTLGTNDDDINIVSPSIIGKQYGVYSLSTFNYYDGVLKGKTDAYSSVTTLNLLADASIHTEEVDEYKVCYLVK